VAACREAWKADLSTQKKITPLILCRVVQVSPEDRAALERLMGLGFSQPVALQAYLACDRNEEIAANYLLEHGAELEGDAMDEGGQ